MEVRAKAPVPLEGGIAIEFLPPYENGLLLQFEDLSGPDADFYGSDHWIEVCDQAFSDYGGVESLALSDDRRRCEVRLKFDAGELGSNFTMVFDEPLDEPDAMLLARLAPKAEGWGSRARPGL